MSNRRRLRPHELARRDQMLAEAKARLRRGEGVIWTDRAEPGTQCTYCDCEWDPRDPSDHHALPGYVCPYSCPADAASVVIVLSSPAPHLFSLCERHYGGWCADFAKLGQPAGINTLGPWMDHD